MNPAFSMKGAASTQNVRNRVSGFRTQIKSHSSKDQLHDTKSEMQRAMSKRIYNCNSDNNSLSIQSLCTRSQNERIAFIDELIE